MLWMAKLGLVEFGDERLGTRPSVLDPRPRFFQGVGLRVVWFRI